MLRIALFFILALCCRHAAAQDSTRLSVLAGVEMTTIFDNREYSPLREQQSGTHFSARFAPWLGIQWFGHNRLVAGVGFRKDFGLDNRFMTDFDPHFYYQYADRHYIARMGIFNRSLMLGRMSDIVHDEWYDFHDDHILGAHLAWHTAGNYAELAVSWDGQPTLERRERFRVLSTAMRPWRICYFGYDFSMTHLANDANPDSQTGVVDYIQLLPYAGLRFHAFFDFDIRATAVGSLQRDRRAGETCSLAGGMGCVTISRWGASLAYQFYGGDGQEPFRQRYGELLYTSNPLYGNSHYHKASVSYTRSFFDNTVSLDVRFVAHSDGRRLGTQQFLTLGVNLEHAWRK